MKRTALVATLLLVALFAAFTAAAQEKAQIPEPKAPEMTAEQKAAMEAMIKAGTPGEPHKLLASMEGHWKAVVKSWQAPGAPPEVMEGTSENKMILSGRYLKQVFKGSFAGQPFDGIGLTGYDNVTKKVQGIWIDSMSTCMMFSTGEIDASGKAIASIMTYGDPISGKAKTSRDVVKIVGPDQHVMEMYDTGPDGKEFLMMEITYTRVK
jgi:hypothetical protein